MNINHKNILAAFKADLKSAEQLKLSNDEKVQQWRDEYEGKPYGNEVVGNSAVVSRDIKKQSEWQHASIIEPFVSTPEIVRCLPVTFEDVEAARQNEILLNTQFCRKFPRFNFVTKAAKILDQEGTLIVQVGWDYEEEQNTVSREVIVRQEDGSEVIEVQEVTETTIKRNQPTAQVCRTEDVYIDPTCQDNYDKAQFIIYRYESDISTLRKDGRYKNLEKLSGGNGTVENDVEYSSPDKTNFQFKDEPRKKLVVYEYWGNYDIDGDGIAEPIVAAWIGDTIIRLTSNPYPDGKIPFLIVPYNSVPFKPYGEANAELISNNQKVKTAIIRGIIDNMAKSNNAQVGMRKGALDSTNRSRFLKGSNFEFNGSPNDFWQGSYNSIPGSVFDMLGLMNNEIESLTGTKSFSGGISGASLGNSATAARGALDAAASRRMNIVRNIAENLIKPLMRKWMAYNYAFLEDTEIVRITNNDFVEVRKDDLSGYIDIEITVATAEDNASKAEELSFLLQTLGPTEDPSIRRELMASIMDLMRMPDAARKMREYQPEPDPVQQQLQELELERLRKEIALLDYKAAELNSRAVKAESEVSLVQAKAEYETARAESVRTDTDLKDLDFLMKDEGVEEKRRFDEFERKRLHELDIVALQLRNGDKNAGVPRS